MSYADPHPSGFIPKSYVPVIIPSSERSPDRLYQQAFIDLTFIFKKRVIHND
jgi:hypothetical protein